MNQTFNCSNQSFHSENDIIMKAAHMRKDVIKKTSDQVFMKMMLILEKWRRNIMKTF